jgi:hypothetical protein
VQGKVKQQQAKIRLLSFNLAGDLTSDLAGDLTSDFACELDGRRWRSLTIFTTNFALRPRNWTVFG